MNALTTLHGSLTPDQVDRFLSYPLIARLATAVPSRQDPHILQPHNVPVWYHWDGEAIWISAFTSTRKVQEARKNPYVSILIDVETEMDGVKAVLMEGKTDWISGEEIVKEISLLIYTHYMGEEGVKDAAPQSWAADMENSLIRLVPNHIYTW